MQQETHLERFTENCDRWNVGGENREGMRPKARLPTWAMIREMVTFSLESWGKYSVWAWVGNKLFIHLSIIYQVLPLYQVMF